MTDYQGNSHKEKEAKKEPKEERKPLEKVITGEAIVKEKGIGRKMRNTFFGGDLKTAANYVLVEVIVPASKEAIYNIFAKGSERVIFGESRVRPSRSSGRGNVQYNNPLGNVVRNSTMLPNQPPRIQPHSMRRDSSDILVSSREEAIAVLETMATVVDQYDVVSVADLNELLGQPSSAIDNKWGWSNLNSSDVRAVRNGYLLELPPMEEI